MAAVDDVRVAVDETRRQQPAGSVDALGAGEAALDPGGRTDGGDAPANRRDGAQLAQLHRQRRGTGTGAGVAAGGHARVGEDPGHGSLQRHAWQLKCGGGRPDYCRCGCADAARHLG